MSIDKPFSATKYEAHRTTATASIPTANLASIDPTIETAFGASISATDCEAYCTTELAAFISAIPGAVASANRPAVVGAYCTA